MTTKNTDTPTTFACRPGYYREPTINHFTCERCGKTITSHKARKTATGAVCKKGTRCYREWKRGVLA